MKPEEAKKYLECFVCDGSMALDVGPIRTEVLIAAIKALEKQVPKKPHKVYDVTEDGYFYYSLVCDECGYVIDEDEFCPNCGQRIDWKV